MSAWERKLTGCAAAGLLLGSWSCAKVSLGASSDGGRLDAVDVALPSASDAALLPSPRDAPLPPDTAGPFACGVRGLGNAGCSFFAAEPVMLSSAGCYAMVVVNPGTRPARLGLQRGTETFVVEQVARLPRGSGENLTYLPYDNTAGLAPGDVAIVFLTGQGTGPGTQAYANGCPLGTIGALPVSTNTQRSSHLGQAFHLTSDQPVVAYDINPFGGVNSVLSSATLLLPVEAWSGNYVAAVPPHAVPTNVGASMMAYDTFILVIASQDGTEVSVRAPVPTLAVPGSPPGTAGQTLRLRLNAGQFAQVMEAQGNSWPGMSGTLISSDKPIGVIGGSPCMFIPVGSTACDAGHQQVPPLSSWGHEYAAVQNPSRWRARKEEPVPWQVVAAVGGTVLTYLPRPPTPYAPPGTMAPVPAPTTLAAGQTVQFWTDEPFVVRSQDAAHPIHLAGMMTGGHFLTNERVMALGEWSAGDPEFVNAVATDQYATDTTFFTDPTYPETSLVVVRRPGPDGRFTDVKLGCASVPIAGWSPVGPLEFARVELVKRRYQPGIPGCDNGVHRMTSTNPFSVTVWGWGPTVSYAYPGGTALRPINDVVIVL